MKDALDRLRSENPLPELLPGLPFELVADRLDDPPPHPMRHAGRRSRVYRAVQVLVPVAVVAAVVAIVLGVGRHQEGARPGSPAITGSIHLTDRAVQSGQTVRGELLFENRTSKTKVLLHGCKIDGLYAIELRGPDGHIQAPAFSLVGCRSKQALVAKPGTTVYRFTMPTTYTQCSQSAKNQRPKNSKYWTPLCLENSSGQRDIMPPLPAGNYTTLFVPNGKWHGPHVKPGSLVIRTK